MHTRVDLANSAMRRGRPYSLIPARRAEKGNRVHVSLYMYLLPDKIGRWSTPIGGLKRASSGSTVSSVSVNWTAGLSCMTRMIRTRTTQATAGRVLWLGTGFILSFSRHAVGGGGGATTPGTVALWPMWPTAVVRPQVMTLERRVSTTMGGHGRRGPTRHSCGKQWPVLLQ